MRDDWVLYTEFGGTAPYAERLSAICPVGRPAEFWELESGLRRVCSAALPTERSVIIRGGVLRALALCRHPDGPVWEHAAARLAVRAALADYSDMVVHVAAAALGSEMGATCVRAVLTPHRQRVEVWFPEQPAAGAAQALVNHCRSRGVDVSVVAADEDSASASASASAVPEPQSASTVLR